MFNDLYDNPDILNKNLSDNLAKLQAVEENGVGFSIVIFKVRG